METRIITLSVNRSHYNIEGAADDSMTVAELIEELRYLPGDCKVVFKNDNGYTYGYISDRDIDSEYVEPEEEHDDILEDVDMIYDISEKVRHNGDKPVKIGAVWFGDAEAVAVGFNDSRVLGVALDNEEFLPIDQLSGDELYEIWTEMTIINK